jgi:hypothetical protein
LIPRRRWWARLASNRYVSIIALAETAAHEVILPAHFVHLDAVFFAQLIAEHKFWWLCLDREIQKPLRQCVPPNGCIRPAKACRAVPTALQVTKGG